MQPRFDWLALAGILGAFQGLILSAVLWTIPRPQRIPLRFMAVSILAVSLNNLGSLLFYTRYIFEVAHLARVHTPLMFGIMVGFYFYTQSYLNPTFRFRALDLWHFFPVVACAIWLLPIYLQNTASKVAYLEAQYKTISTERYFTAILGVLHSIIYFVLIVKQLLHANKLSSISKTKIHWIRWLSWSWVLLLGFVLYRFLVDFTYNTSFVVPLAYFFTVYALGYIALWRPEFLDGTVKHSPPKYSNSTLTADKSMAYWQGVNRLMETEKIYLKADLTLYGLAESMRILPHHLSQVINEHSGQNFFDFVNAYRIKEIQHRLKDPANDIYTLAAIAEQTGFSSKSTFNTAFKKHTGLTPTAFKKQAIRPNL